MTETKTPFTHCDSTKKKKNVRNTQLNFIQINLQHSKTATDNLMHVINLKN